ncbi:MAG: restriction endonuclease subunit S [Bacteroidales bacterium]|nr:restriction endonuclease subunit S [Bacteroidales bacterium]
MSNHIPVDSSEEKIFVVNRSEIEGRLEPNFYLPEITNLEKKVRGKSSRKLGDFALSVSGGATPKKADGDKYYADAKTGIPFLRVQNLNADGSLSLTDCLYINKETHDGMLSRSQVNGGDLLVKITGVGRMAIASVAPDGFVGNTNQHMVVIKTGNVEISKYLSRYLNLNIIERIASRHSTGGTRPALDYPSIKNIPIIEGIDFSTIDEAIVKKKQKYEESQNLLKGIDEYLFAELYMISPKIGNELEYRLFKFNKRYLGDRFDPEYTRVAKCHPYSNVFDNVALNEVAYIKKGTAMTSDKAIPGNIPIIAGGKTPAGRHNVGNFGGDVITVSASGAYSGYVWYHDNPIFATDCNVVFSKDKSRFLTKYLYEVLRLQQEYIYQLQTGAAQPHIYASNIRGLKIPDIPIAKQIEIVDKISETRLLAKSLVNEGEKILNEANKEVERMILGDL